MSLEGGATGRVDIIDVATLSVRATVPRYVYALTDEVAATVSELRPNIDVVELDTGKVLANISVYRDQDEDATGPYTFISSIGGDDTFILEYIAGQTLVVGSISASEHSLTELLAQGLSARSARPLYVEPALSDSETLVLLPEIGAATAIAAAGGQVLATTFRVSTRDLASEAFAIGAP